MMVIKLMVIKKENHIGGNIIIKEVKWKFLDYMEKIGVIKDLTTKFG
jgi:hypothetical protein